jgi:FlaA1/EpsC-like NDP-sugar epimerase
MGATKRLAEMVCQAIQQSGNSTTGSTRFALVRFGNVVGSAGSVIPKFQEQIERGGPVTVTHPEVTRFFMSIPEAAQLVLQAGSMGEGGEIYVMDMGAPLKIADLARDMIRLAGHTEQDIRIEFTGLRPGEKLYEEVLAPNEQTLATPHPKLRIARARPVDPEWLLAFVRTLEERSDQGDDATRRMLHRLVPEYTEPPHDQVLSPNAHRDSSPAQRDSTSAPRDSTPAQRVPGD